MFTRWRVAEEEREGGDYHLPTASFLCAQGENSLQENLNHNHHPNTTSSAVVMSSLVGIVVKSSLVESINPIDWF